MGYYIMSCGRIHGVAADHPTEWPVAFACSRVV